MATEEETNAALLKKLAVLERQVRAEKPRIAAQWDRFWAGEGEAPSSEPVVFGKPLALPQLPPVEMDQESEE